MARITSATYGSSAPAKVRRGSSAMRASAEVDDEERVAAVKVAVDECPAMLERHGIEPGRPYGCGSYGCVYPAGRGRVAKLSWDVGEAELAVLFARARGEHPAIPIIYYVGHLPPTCGTYKSWERGAVPSPLYVVMREDLRDLKELIEPDAIRRLNTLLVFLPGFDGKRYRARAVTDDMIAELQNRWPIAYGFWLQAIDFALWTLRNQVVLADTHLDNWGVRGGRQIVLRDFGLSSSDRAPSADAVPVLQGLHLRQRGLAGLGRLGLRVRGTRRRGG